ncbi:MarR family winged helix-turn-helix transcriptional regulator [Haematomicrobium sanguinis]|uniref:MarR family winged helix-turn-helix transcriptional regulator n=1 Tax=Haematomicrobium sanguinis TaxID=479106 RepID=UPI00047C7F4F|nr:MarR family transcriptional regulator [Haematomicrobium sanguinis]
MTARSGTPGSAKRETAVRGLEIAFASLGAAYRRFFAAAAETVSPGLVPGALKALMVINRVGPTQLSTLVPLLHSDKGMVSRQVSELERLGLVERQGDPDDARVRLIQISELGAERLEQARRPHLDRLHRILADWPIEDIDKLAGLLNEVSEG